MIFFSERSLRYAADQYLEHYHKERNHQGLDSKIIRSQFQHQENTGEIKCSERLALCANNSETRNSIVKVVGRGEH